MTDFYPKARNNMTFHHLLPGYNYGLVDPSDAFYSRQIVSFQAQQNQYAPTVQAMLNLSNNEAYLDVDNSTFQAVVTFDQQFAANNTAGSQNDSWVLDQFASSIVDRLVIKAGGQTLQDFQYFSDYHHTKMLTVDDTAEQMAGFSESIAALATQSSAVDYSDDTNLSVANLQALAIQYGQQASGVVGGTTYYNALNDCIKERMIEDIKRNAKFFQLTTDIGASLASNLNQTYAPRNNGTNAMNNYLVICKLSDLPCFSSKQYFPLFCLNGPMQFQFTWKQPIQCMHRSGFAAGVVGTALPSPSSLNYTIYNLELVCALIYPKPDFIEKFMLESVAANEAFYKCEYVETGLLGLPAASSTLLYNVSMARLSKSIYLKKELLQDGALGSANAVQEGSTRRYSVDEVNPATGVVIGGFNYRGYKWYSPWGDISQIYTRVNGISYPNANSSVLINEHLIKEQTEQVLGKLIGLRDPRRYFFDQQVLAFSYKKDTHSNSLVDVSGINTSNNNQVQFIVNLKNTPASTTSILGIHFGEMVMTFTTAGQLLLYR